ncbi:Ubiquitin conjugation factor E4 B [Marasmius tenuissimus]|uniref:Ubiquitin conjugation factor E4 B n=1 Tax=Marasmius tenuissimus TaxID=585030 RepID=A0ABR2ZQV2_9AGAR
MIPEVADKLAAMLEYNLVALAGSRCQEYEGQGAGEVEEVFVRAITGDGRSHGKEIFKSAERIMFRKGPQTDREAKDLLHTVEEAKATLEAEEDQSEIPDEFLGAYFSV